jgi:hypothetical protein
MMRAVSVAALVLTLTSPASAQLRPEGKTGSIAANRPDLLRAADAAVVRKSFARCIYYSSKKTAASYLEHSDLEAVDMNAAGIRDRVRDFKMESCLSNEVNNSENALAMRSSATTLRDLLAEEAYLAKNHSVPASAATAEPIAFRPVATDTNPTATQGLAMFADCTVRHDTAGADALLRTVPESPREQQAAAALAPAMGACLMTGQNFALKPANIRALVAYAMWSRFGR